MVDTAFQKFYCEVKEIERRDSVLTPQLQIDRLNRPGSNYFNLNPFDVLQVDPETPLAEIKKKYRQLSLLVHPDKNPDDKDRSQRAFEACNKASKILEDEDGYQRCQQVVQEAKTRVDAVMEEKRKKNKKEGKGTAIEEDDSSVYRRAVYVQTCKLFADLERLRISEENRAANERKRKFHDNEEEKERREHEKEWQKNYEESRTERVESWRSFAGPSGKAKKKKKTFVAGGFKPPKHKSEQRPAS